MKAYILRNKDDLDSLKSSWTRLENHAALPMQHFIWAQACARVHTQEGELRILVLEENGEVVAIAPLVHRQGSPRLEILGVAQHSEPTDVIFARPEALVSLANALVDLGMPLLLRRLPVNSPLIEPLKEAFRRRGMLFCRPEASWPWITIDSSWADPESKYNSKRRAYLRRSRRKADAFGKVTFETLAPTPEALPALLEEVFAVEASGWKGRDGSAMAADPKRGDFFRQYAKGASEKGILRLCFMRIDGRAAAMQLGVEACSGLCIMKIGYEERFASCAPGNLLIENTLREAALRGLRFVGFMGKIDPWKEQWTRESIPCVVLRGYPWNRRGMSALAGDLAHFAAIRMHLRARDEDLMPSYEC